MKLVTRLITGLVAIVSGSATPALQATPCIRFIVYSNIDSTTIPGASIWIASGRVGGAADLDGTLVLCPDRVGTIGWRATSIGFLPDSGSIDLAAEDQIVTLRIYLEPIVEAGELITVVGEGLHRRGGWTGELAGAELHRLRGSTVAATLEELPGFASLSTGPMTSQTVARGLSGDRVTVTLDGSATSDASAFGVDHAVTLAPGLARTIDVLHGPEAFLLGSAPLGGVIDVKTGLEQTDRAISGFAGLLGESGTRQVGGTTALVYRPSDVVTTEAFGTYRLSGDLVLTEGERMPNSDGTALQTGARVRWSPGTVYTAAEVDLYKTDYGVPPDPAGPHPEGVRLDMQRSTGRLVVGLGRSRTSIRPHSLTITGTDYQHQEIESQGIIGVAFGRAQTTLEYRGAFEDSSSRTIFGAGYTFADVTSRGLRLAPSHRHAGHLVGFHERQIGIGTIGATVRFDHLVSLERASVRRERTHSGFSGAVSGLLDLTESASIGLSSMLTFRAPDTRELFSEGPHAASRTFEIGNPEIGAERALGTELFLHGESERIDGEIRLFHTRFFRFLGSRPTGDTNRASGLPISIVDGTPAVMVGSEVDLSLRIIPEHLTLRGNLEFVFGEETETDRPMRRIPPLSTRIGVEYRTGRLVATVAATRRASQRRVGEFESTSPGSTLLGCNLYYSLIVGETVHGISLRATNLLDTPWQDHLSNVRDLYGGAGRSVTLHYQLYL